MKVVIVSKALVVGSYRKKLEELVRLGVDVTAVIPPLWREGGGELPLEPGSDHGYSTFLSPVRMNGHFHLHYYPELPRILRFVRPDLVHLDEEPYNLATYLGVRAASKFGIPSLFFTWQNLLRRYPFPFSALERSVYRRASAAIAGSEEAAGVLREKGYRGKLAIVPQFGVDPELFFPGPMTNGPFRVGFLNRLISAKAPFVMLDAFERLPAESRLCYVGDGPLRAELEAEIARRSLSSRVTVRPRIPSVEIPDLLRTLHAVVLPSLTTPRWKEQFGRVLIEAMACGIPVVGSDSGEIPHVIGDAGMVVPEGDSSSLAVALRRLYDDGTLWSDLRERGVARVCELYSNGVIARQTYNVYAVALQ